MEEVVHEGKRGWKQAQEMTGSYEWGNRLSNVRQGSTGEQQPKSGAPGEL